MGNLTININAAAFFKAILVVLFFVVLYILRDLVLVLLTAVVIASAIEPMTKWFIRYRAPRVIAVIFIYVVFAALLISIFYFFLPPLFNEISGLLSSLPAYFQSLDVFTPAAERLLNSKSFIEQFSEQFSIQESVSYVHGLASNVSGGVVQSLSSIFGGIL
ncbi:MAG: AI-2E family transporter, partial [bacterium]|nr:AI-2E family transporter [bacterium]